MSRDAKNGSAVRALVDVDDILVGNLDGVAEEEIAHGGSDVGGKPPSRRRAGFAGCFREP